MYFMQERMIFHPQPLDEARRTAIRGNSSVEEIFLPTADARLHAWYIKGDPLILYFGGNAEDVSWMIEEAPARAPGVGWLLTSYRGYGGSEGAPSEAALSADALAWYDYAAREIKPNKILTLGRSLGSGVAVHLAAERPVGGVILAAPYSSLVHVAKHYYPWLPVRIMLRHKFDSIGKAPGIRAPLLCLVAGRDEVIPPVLARRLFDAWGGPKTWVAMEGAGHNTADSHPLFWQNVTEFLVRMRA
jgi:pimeloyl-ACP methyl ester carboxylesterase